MNKPNENTVEELSRRFFEVLDKKIWDIEDANNAYSLADRIQETCILNSYPLPLPSEKIDSALVKRRKVMKRAGLLEKRKPLEEKIEEIPNHIYVPSIGLYVSKEVEMHGTSWENAHYELHEKGKKMLTLPEFWGFLSYLIEQSREDEKSKGVLDDIIRPGITKGEFLDGIFKPDYGFLGNEFVIGYDHTLKDNRLESNVTEQAGELSEGLYKIPSGEETLPQSASGFPFYFPRNNIYYSTPKFPGHVVVFGSDEEKAGIFSRWMCQDKSSRQIGVRPAIRPENLEDCT